MPSALYFKYTVLSSKYIKNCQKCVMDHVTHCDIGENEDYAYKVILGLVGLTNFRRFEVFKSNKSDNHLKRGRLVTDTAITTR